MIKFTGAFGVTDSLRNIEKSFMRYFLSFPSVRYSFFNIGFQTLDRLLNDVFFTQNQVDGWLWKRDKKGMLRLSSLLDDFLMKVTLGVALFKSMPRVPKKVIISVWCLTCDRFPTRVNLIDCDVNVDIVFRPMGDEGSEDHEHLFTCQLVVPV